MLPGVGLLMIGHGQWPTLPLPLPLFLFWPFLLLVVGLLAVVERLFPTDDPAHAKLALARRGVMASFHLSGLRVDVESSNGGRLRVWLL